MVDRGKWDGMINSNSSVNEGEIVPLWNTCEKAELQDLALAQMGVGWPNAVIMFIENGIVSRTFIKTLLMIRHLWQETKLKFLLQEGERSLQVLADLLYPYILKKGKGWTVNKWCNTGDVHDKAQISFLNDLFQG